MAYAGTVHNGTIVLEPDIEIPDGSKVWVMPDELSLDDVVDQIRFIYKVRKGLRQADAGETISHEEARERLKHWLK